MRTQTLIKTFCWTEADRSVVALGPETRIVPERNLATLIAADGRFSTDPDLYVKSRVTTPQAVRQWLGFEARVTHKLNAANEQVTSADFRLFDGTDELYWDGADWSVAGPGQWSTEAEVAENIPTLSAASRTLQVVVNLATTDPSLAPELLWVKVAYAAVIEFFEDITLRTLVRLLKQELRPISRVTWEMPADGTEIPLSEAQIETGYQLRDVDSCFNYDADPERLTDILDSYDSGTQTITLTQSLTAGARVWIRFLFEPLVAFTSSQDYIDAATLPAVVLTGDQIVGAVEAPDGGDYVANKADGTAIVVPSPEQGTLEMTALLMAEKQVDLKRLNEEMNRFFRASPIIYSTGIDEGYRLQVVDEHTGATSPQASQSEIYSSQLTLRVHNFRRWLAEATTAPIVENFIPTIQFTS